MADKQDSGDKTEKPTPKRLRDARKKGDIAKSKDVGVALSSLFFLLLFAVSANYIASRFAGFMQNSILVATSEDFPAALGKLTGEATVTLLVSSAIILVPMMVMGMAAEFLQVGALLTGEKMKPQLSKLNPVDGLKRMFGKDGLVEMVKNVIKAALVICATWLVLRASLPEIASVSIIADPSPLGGAGPQAAADVGSLTYALTLRLFGWGAAVFVFVAALDRLYQQHAFMKKMRMSMRDIKQEHKQDEGDPYIKSSRRQMHEEWANQSAVGAVGNSAALLVNPTHLAIALEYDPEDCPVPVIAARGEGNLAALMRAEAERCEVPIIRNVAAARRLWARGEVGEIVPEEMFDVVAEVILWAKKAREGEAPMWNDLGGEPLAFEEQK